MAVAAADVVVVAAVAAVVAAVVAVAFLARVRPPRAVVLVRPMVVFLTLLPLTPPAGANTLIRDTADVG